MVEDALVILITCTLDIVKGEGGVEVEDGAGLVAGVDGGTVGSALGAGAALNASTLPWTIESSVLRLDI
jgi:hypothetical protein